MGQVSRMAVPVPETLILIGGHGRPVLSGEKMNIESIKYMLMVQDMDRALSFYTGVIGLEVGYQSDFWSELRLGDAIVALHGGGSADTEETGLIFQVDNIEAAVREIENGGGRVVSRPSDPPGEPIRLARVVDPEGNAFSLDQRK